VRRFREEVVDDELILKVVDVARYAPSAKNSQPWEFIVVKDRGLKEALASIHPYAYPIRQAPVTIAVICDPSKSPVSYMLDCANATMYLLLAAHCLGLGAVWIQTLRNVDDVRRILRVPEGKVPTALVAIGWPAETPGARPRKELSEILFLNYYGELFSTSKTSGSR